ncbi:MAG: hypothetical protein KGH71_00145 [Candidatus Micrarchaeota archaeon]|nr:hypothetical protein [Candidatus Micrarchaeota archaeon]
MACECANCKKQIKFREYCWICSECYNTYCIDCAYIGGVDPDTNSCECLNCREPMTYTTCQNK